MSDAKTLLQVDNLTIALPGGSDRRYAVEGLGLTLCQGETVCLVGESGSGKSMTAYAIAGLLSERLTVSSGEIHYHGQNLVGLPEARMRTLRGAGIAMIFQEPMTALNPLLRCGDQVVEMFEAHGRHSRTERRTRTLALFKEVGLPSPEKAFTAYPHELSGGQRQRVMIAMALALEPDVIIADEPTTALDVTTQAQILKLLERLRRDHGTAILFITHDFGVVAEIAHHVVVMKSGRVVESGLTRDVLLAPQADYTRKLLAAIPTMASRLPVQKNVAQENVLSVRALCKSYDRKQTTMAVDHVNLALRRGETIGVVGESGSGKSTLGRCIMRLIESDSGAIDIDGQNILTLSRRDMKPFRRRVQMVFQDPFASLNQRRRVGHIIAEGAIVHGEPRAQAYQRARALLEQVGLERSAFERFPADFSGGQRQRIGLARALALEPEIIIADEIVSALDVSVQAQILALLAELKARMSLSMIFITHDLRVAASICDRIIVMQKGRVVEAGETEAIFNHPTQDYTRLLLASVPGMDLERERQQRHAG